MKMRSRETTFTFWSISRVILFSFSLLLIINFSEAIFGNKNLSDFATRFSDFRRVNDDANLVQDIDKGVSELQRYILIYHQTQGRSSISQLEHTHNQLVSQVNKLLSNNELPSKEILDLARKLKSGIDRFEEKISSLQQQRSRRDQVINSELGNQYHQLESILTDLTSQQYITNNRNLSASFWEIRFNILNAERLSSRYFENHDYALLKSVFESIEKSKYNLNQLTSDQKDNSSTSSYEKLSTSLRDLKTVMHKSVQADRSYMFLVNVVMAGESSELGILADKLKLELIHQQNIVSTETKEKIENGKNLTLITSAAAFIIALIAAIIVSRRIRNPLLSITHTFDRLIKGKSVDKIPYSHRKDEIGHLARAADIFRKNTIKTQMLLVQSEKYSDELESKKEDLEVAVLQAQEASETKGQFLASMSHEIRTPMNGVIGMLNLLLKEPLTEKQKRCAELAQTSAKSLLTLINDILDFSKIEAGKLDIECITFDLQVLFDEFSESMRHQIEDKGLSLNTSFSTNGTTLVKGDSGRIRQILTNLVGNAIKFTEQGSISINAVMSLNSSNQVHRLDCEVIDTGIGIPEENVHKLFDSFTQADSSTTRNFGGTGLGLAIVRQLCRLMNGDVGLTSQVDRGSCFSFNIELDIADTHTKAPTRKSTNKKNTETALSLESDIRHRVLLVEDNAINQEVVKGALEDLALQLDVAWNGQEALDMLESEPEPAYELILMDCQMPIMDGYTATQIIREQDKGKNYRNIPIIALTANAMLGDKESCLQAGMNDYLTKPIDQALLERCVIRWLDIKSHASHEPPSPTSFIENRASKDQIDKNIWDRVAALARVRNREDRLAILIKMFLDAMPDRIEQLELEVNNGESSAASKIAHQIKGVSGNLSITELYNISEVMEQAGKQEDIESLRQELPKLLDAYQRIEDILISANNRNLAN